MNTKEVKAFESYFKTEKAKRLSMTGLIVKSKNFTLFTLKKKKGTIFK